jgi:cysteinyl-tRNA synthetase
MLKIYNSYSQSKEVFQPIAEGQVKIYVCGMTVYDYCHLGHMRMLVNFDVIIRVLRFLHYKVTYVRNITDIDDKIIKRAQENQEDYRQLTQRYINYMHEDMQDFALLPPDHEPCATSFIPEMLKIISMLIEKKYAYITSSGDVYFAVRHFKNYGCLAGRNLAELTSGMRVAVNEAKQDPLDFVLWKQAKPNEPNWSSPWGPGRPGWHIECSAMSMHFLGSHFDLHGGGKDLIFPHHENEIAQSEAATGKKFANYWLHNGHVEVDMAKMSKSSGNFVTIRDLRRKYSAEVIRYFIIASHYRSPLNFNVLTLAQAQQALKRYYLALRDLAIVPVTAELLATAFAKNFIIALADDFNTPVALANLFALAHEVQRLRQHSVQEAAAYAALLRHLGGVLGLLQLDPVSFLQDGNSDIDVALVAKLVQERDCARAAKNWREADRLRDQLAAMAVIVEDTPSGSKWYCE